MKNIHVHRLAAIGVVFLLILANVSMSWGFAEEALHFRDPNTGEVTDEEVSSIHTDLVYTLALAAGFTDADAARILIWDQLVDSEQLGIGAKVTYHNCLGGFPDAPNPDDAGVCPAGKGAGAVIWPKSANAYNGLACTTSRFGVFSPFFHFPRTDNGELENIRNWAFGETQVLQGYAAYAWGTENAQVIDAACRYQMPVTIETGIQPGSLEAFATYLHMLADSISHRVCIADLMDMTPTLPGIWGTHTVLKTRDPKSCFYNPQSPSNDDEHGQEFGAGTGTDRSDDAGKAIYDELVNRSYAKEGNYYAIDWSAPLTGMAGSPTLQQVAFNFIHNWGFQKDTGSKGEYAYSRHAYADEIAAAIRAQRKKAPRTALNSISPTKSQTAGLGTQVTLTANGKNFAADAVVRWNGEALVTTYVSAGKVTAIIPANRIAAEGSAKITVFNPHGGGESGSKTFGYSYPSPTLSKLNPSGAAVNGSPFVLTLTGKKFVPVSKVWWTFGETTTELPVVYVSNTELKVPITAPMLGKAGTAKVYVETQGAKSLKSSKLSFAIK